MRRAAVIMAGGSGERFWPASRRARPKQLLRLTDARASMLEEALTRISPLIPPADVLIVTSEQLAAPIRRALPGLPAENVLAEPVKRNTAACLALAQAELERRFGDPSRFVVAVLTADHRIGAADRFRETVAAAMEFAATEPALVTIGIEPTRPETGYGWIEAGERVARETPVGAIHPVAAFREKPDLATAAGYLASGRHLWNSGMFFWRGSTLAAELARHMPELAHALPAMRAALAEGAATSGPARDRLRDVFTALADVSIDVGLMERAGGVHVIRASFPWDDLGAWDALARLGSADAAGNVLRGEVIALESRDCIAYAAGSAGDSTDTAGAAGGPLIALVGVEDLVVAASGDAVLVCRRDRAQDVKAIVAELRRRGLERLL